MPSAFPSLPGAGIGWARYNSVQSRRLIRSTKTFCGGLARPASEVWAVGLPRVRAPQALAGQFREWLHLVRRLRSTGFGQLLRWQSAVRTVRAAPTMTVPRNCTAVSPHPAGLFLPSCRLFVCVPFDTEQPIAKACVLLENASFEDDAMARYVLRLRDGDKLLPDDEEGQEFATVDEIRRVATDSARQLLSAAVLMGTAGSLNQQIDVIDEAGKTVLTMPVGHAVGTESQT